MVKPRVYSAFDLPPDQGIDCSSEPSMTQQCFKDECDINVILRRFENGGAVESFNDRPASYVDTSEVPDYHSAQNLLIEAQVVFNELPTKVRKRFRDPADLLSFLADSSNLEEARELGLCKPSEEPSPAGPSDSPSAGEGSSQAPVGPGKGV